MTKFKLYEDILSRFWNRYFYDVEANTMEEAVEKVRYEKVDCYDSEQIYELIDGLDSENNNGNPTRKIYNDKDELMWHNAEPVNREEIITQSIKSISKNLSLIMKDEPESFIGGDIALSTVVKVMESLGWKFCTYDGFDTNRRNIDHWLYFIKDEKDFSYRAIGNVYFGGVKIEKCEKHYER